jgi:hypothetical protein
MQQSSSSSTPAAAELQQHLLSIPVGTCTLPLASNCTPNTLEKPVKVATLCS